MANLSTELCRWILETVLPHEQTKKKGMKWRRRRRRRRRPESERKRWRREEATGLGLTLINYQDTAFESSCPKDQNYRMADVSEESYDVVEYIPNIVFLLANHIISKFVTFFSFLFFPSLYWFIIHEIVIPDALIIFFILLINKKFEYKIISSIFSGF